MKALWKSVEDATDCSHSVFQAVATWQMLLSQHLVWTVQGWSEYVMTVLYVMFLLAWSKKFTSEDELRLQPKH